MKTCHYLFATVPCCGNKKKSNTQSDKSLEKVSNNRTVSSKSSTSLITVYLQKKGAGLKYLQK